jgi:hypothetical protein
MATSGTTTFDLKSYKKLTKDVEWPQQAVIALDQREQALTYYLQNGPTEAFIYGKYPYMRIN